MREDDDATWWEVAAVGCIALACSLTLIAIICIWVSLVLS